MSAVAYTSMSMEERDIMLLYSESHSDSDKHFHLLECFLFYSYSFKNFPSAGCYVKAANQVREEASQIGPIVQIHVCKDLFSFSLLLFS